LIQGSTRRAAKTGQQKQGRTALTTNLWLVSNCHAAGQAALRYDMIHSRRVCQVRQRTTIGLQSAPQRCWCGEEWRQRRRRAAKLHRRGRQRPGCGTAKAYRLPVVCKRQGGRRTMAASPSPSPPSSSTAGGSRGKRRSFSSE
jgi:hypothetical protein